MQTTTVVADSGFEEYGQKSNLRIRFKNLIKVTIFTGETLAKTYVNTFYFYMRIHQLETLLNSSVSKNITVNSDNWFHTL